MRATTRALILAIILVAATQLIAAAGAQRWIQGGREEFLKGDPEAASISSDGVIMLPPSASKVFDSAQQFVWDLAVDGTGRLFAAGGTEGVIYDSRGNPVHDSDKPEVRALTFGPDGSLYFATSPMGAVYRLREGSPAEEFYVPKNEDGPPERYIWDLAFDRAGNLYIATGIEGRLYRVGPNGEGSVVFDSDQMHITSLAFDSSGGLVFGSDPGGQIFRLSQGDKPFVLFDSPLREISAVAVAPDGSIYATAIADEALKQTAQQSGEEQQPAALSPSSVVIGNTGSGTVVSNEIDGGRSNGEISALYRVGTDGTVATLWYSKTDVAYSLATDREGTVFIGTGPKGRLIAVAPNGDYRVLRRLDGMQVTALLSTTGQLYAGCSNLGHVFRISRQFAESGSFLSQVKDTGTVSSFGALRWRAAVPTGTSLRLMTRSGNTSEPDNTWSDWSGAYTDAAGSVVSSPAARFVQWKAEMSTTEPGASPRLESVALYYLQNNLRPRVESVTVLPPGAFFRPLSPADPLIASMPADTAAELRTLGFVSSGPPPRGQVIYSREMRAFTWDASDFNGDELVFRLLIREAGSDTWRPLAEKVEDFAYNFDTRILGDGEYVIRVEASDSPSNPPDKALLDSLDSWPFLVDNTPPMIEGLAATASTGSVTISFEASDETSSIRRIRVRIGAGEWRPVLPEDGIADSGRERVSIRLEGVASGDHAVAVQVFDELHNVGSGSTSVTVR